MFSFHPVKIITTGEGGVATTNSSAYEKKMRIFRDNGIKRIKNNWRYKHVAPGYNYRMNDISAALGISQLKSLGKFLKKRNLIAQDYRKLFKKSPNSNSKNFTSKFF